MADDHALPLGKISVNGLIYVVTSHARLEFMQNVPYCNTGARGYRQPHTTSLHRVGCYTVAEVQEFLAIT